MTKSQWIARVAKQTGLTKKTVTLACDALLTAAGDAFAEGEDLHLSGFGVFSVKEKAQYTARNPKTNERVEMPSSRRVTFTASKLLKEKINET